MKIAVLLLSVVTLLTSLNMLKSIIKNDEQDNRIKCLEYGLQYVGDGFCADIKKNI